MSSREVSGSNWTTLNKHLRDDHKRVEKRSRDTPASYFWVKKGSLFRITWTIKTFSVCPFSQSFVYVLIFFCWLLCWLVKVVSYQFIILDYKVFLKLFYVFNIVLTRSKCYKCFQNYYFGYGQKVVIFQHLI